MITGFGNPLAEDLFHGLVTRAVRSFPLELRRSAQRKLEYLNAAKSLSDLRVPPGNRLEGLKGKLREYDSIRINDQWRIVFRWEGGNAANVQAVDYH